LSVKENFSNMSHEKITVGLALGGGAARGIAHIGILQELEHVEMRIDCLAGTSAGAVVGALYASGITTQELKEFARSLKWRDIFAPHVSLKGLVSGKPLVKLLQTHCRTTRFEDLRIPFAVVASDFETGESVAITKGDLFPAVQASCSIPLLCPPVPLNGRYYIDGGFAAEVPVKAVRDMGADVVIACDVNYQANLLTKPSNFVITLIHLMRLVAKRNAEEAKKQADIVMNVDMSGISLTDFQKGEESIQRGRRTVEMHFPELQKFGGAIGLP
jgi:NTE family protein